MGNKLQKTIKSALVDLLMEKSEKDKEDKEPDQKEPEKPEINFSLSL